MIGVKPSVIWLGWLIRYMAIYLFISVAVIVMGSISYKNGHFLLSKKTFFKQTNSFIAFLVLLFFSIQVTMLNLLFGQFFKKCKKYVVW